MIRTSRRCAVALVAGVCGLVVVASALAVPSRQSATTPVAVKMTEFKFAFTPKTAKKGTVVFTLVNAGKLEHDLKIAGKKSSKVAKGKRGTLRVTFTKTGRYPYLCTLPGHAAGGMKGVLVVK
jgi:plastocyanin